MALQDSLQELSRLGPSEQRIVQQIIQKEIAEEKRLAEKRLKKQVLIKAAWTTEG